MAYKNQSVSQVVTPTPQIYAENFRYLDSNTLKGNYKISVKDSRVRVTIVSVNYASSNPRDFGSVCSVTVEIMKLKGKRQVRSNEEM